MSRYIDPFTQYFLNNGDVASDGLLYFFENLDYNTPKATFNFNGDQNTNPVQLDGSGRVPEIFGTGFYSIEFRSASGVLQTQRDYVELNNLTGLVNPTVTGSMTFSGSGARIEGLFSGFPVINRTLFETQALNTNTSVGAIPNGTATSSNFSAFNSSDPDNAALINISASSTGCSVNSTVTGLASYIPLSFGAGGTGRFQLETAGNFIPSTDNAYSIGKSGARATSIWAANGTIQTSDERTKTEVNDSVLGLEFINALRPVSYKFLVGGNTVIPPEEEGGEPTIVPRPGERTHWGLIAQEVKEVCDLAGVDFGGWILTNKDDPDSQQGLRYDQFISVLIKAVQQLSARVEDLESQITP